MGVKNKVRPPLSGAQLEIMAIVWRRGEVSVAGAQAELSARRTLARNTIQTLLTRLERKGWLRHRRNGNAYLYSATAGRRGTLKELVGRLVDKVFAGSVEGLVMTLVDGRRLTTGEADRIQAMIDRSREPAAEKERTTS